jgi:hypothetical protein
MTTSPSNSVELTQSGVGYRCVASVIGFTSPKLGLLIGLIE